MILSVKCEDEIELTEKARNIEKHYKKSGLEFNCTVRDFICPEHFCTLQSYSKRNRCTSDLSLGFGPSFSFAGQYGTDVL